MAAETKVEPPKQGLFKYFHPDRTDVLRNATIRFSSPKVLNDPFELKPHISAFSNAASVSREIDRLLPEHSTQSYQSLPPRVRAMISPNVYYTWAKAKVAPVARLHWEVLMEALLPGIRSTVYTTLEQTLGILCLSESQASLLMWAHYADSHQGFIVEFDSESPFFDQRLGPDDDFRHIRKVAYRSERPAIVLTEIGDFSPFLTKGEDWSYEVEWRMMMPLAMASQIVGEGPTAIHLFPFPKSMVRRVIFGCRITDGKEAEIRQILQTTPGYQHVEASGRGLMKSTIA